MTTTDLERRAANIIVRDDHEWGEFFVRESQSERSDGKTRYSATWCCYSSYGVFGHHWYDMGEPFAKFIQDVDTHYLLGKIARKVQSDKVTVASVKRRILEARKSKDVTRDEARDALDELESVAAEHSGEVLCHELYHSSLISECMGDWCDIESQEWEPAALHFAKKLWPKFVIELAKQAASEGIAKDGTAVLEEAGK
jgi:hypothetical protein